MYLEKIINRLNKHPVHLAIALFLCTVAAALGLLRIPFEGALETMLPEDSKALRTVQFLSDANFSDKVALSVEAGPEAAGTDALIAELNRLAARFEKSPLIENVITFPGSADMMKDLLFFVEHRGELLDEEEIETLGQRTSEEEIHRKVRNWYGRMARPEGSFVVEMMRRDPLDTGTKVLAGIDRLSQSFGYRANLEGGHLIHPDGRHGLLLLETRVSITDTEGAREIVALMEKTTSGLPAGLSADFIAGHRRSVSNERVLRRDITLTAAVASAGFLLLFLVIFRDPRAIVLFLIPGASVLFALNISALLLGRLSYLVIGFGAVLAGIAVDYGIHVYVSVRRSTDSGIAVRRILKPIVIGALTTLSVFTAFLASSIPGYRQLGVFAATSITLSILAAVFLLPALLKKQPKIAAKNGDTNMPTSRPKVVAPAIFFLLSLPVCAAAIPGLSWDTDITRLDGTEKHVLETERHFRKLWADDETGQAIAVVEDESYEQAAEKNGRLHKALAEMHDTKNYGNIALLWPPASERARNLERWNDFWDTLRVEDTRRHLREAGEAHGFSADAFDPFFNALKRRKPAGTPENNAIYEQFEQRFVQEHENGFRFMTFFPDTEENHATVSRALSDIPGSFLASPAALGATLSESIASEVRYISAIALVLIACIITILVRSIRMSVAALLPAAVGLLWLFAVMALSGLTLNIANLIAGIVVIGLCIDYGIFMVHGLNAGPGVLASTKRAITLSAVTTLMGAGVLIFASHPALFSIGLTLVIGVTAGFLCAVLAVPGMFVLMGIKNDY